MQMDAGMSAHIVSLARIDEEVGLRATLDTGVKELQRMLRDDRGVVHSDDDLQPAFQIPGFCQQRGTGVAVRVLFRRIHIPFAVHHLIPFPVYDGAACHADLEDIRICRLCA